MKLKFSNIIKTFTLITSAISMISCGGDSKKESTSSTESQEVWTFPEHIRSMSEPYKETSSAETETPKPKVKLAFMTNATADFWSYGKAGAEKAASEHDDIEIEFKMGDGTAAKQREICDSLLVRGFKGIAISPPNPKGQQYHLNGWAKKAAIITVDSDAPKSDRLFYLGTNNVEAGRQAGELLKEALPDGGQVMVFVGVGDQANAVERYQGLKEAVEGTKIEILDLRTDEANIGKARRNAEDTLTKYPNLAGMVGLWAYNAPACLKAVRDKGAIGKVKIVAFDEEVETLKAIDAGEIHGTVVQQPYEFGYQAIKALRSIIIEGKSPQDLELPDTKQKFIATKMIRKGGGEDYLKQCQEWKSGN
ncbi:sugar-binding protein [Verrucomicrobiales bacterium]|nr:sugar-binding protein [Verrucomicrobiales bacterium]